MPYSVSDNCIRVLKLLYKDEEYKPLKSKKEVQELLFVLGFLYSAGQLAADKKDDEATITLEMINKCGEELKTHLDDLDLDYLNYKMSK